MKIKTADLTGPALDWAVAKSDGWDGPDLASYLFTSRRVKPSVDWSQGGPIIEREEISIAQDSGTWRADICPAHGGDHIDMTGPTPLIAAMRCFVASKLGHEVEIPEELDEQARTDPIMAV
jgi:hypothetical protein